MIAYCPACDIERTDYEGPNAHLPECPNCGSPSDPVPQFSGMDLDSADAMDRIVQSMRNHGFTV